MRVETNLKLFQSFRACDQGRMAETCNAEELNLRIEVLHCQEGLRK